MIKIDSLHKAFNKGKRNEVIALDNMSLELGDKGLYVIYGKSGSGKSTLMNMIGGLDTFDSGSIEVDGNRYEGIVPDAFRIDNIGYIFQNYCLDTNVNVYENVALGLRTIGIEDEELIFNRSMTALANVGMAEYYKRDVTALSGGQQQRVAIARAMAKGAKIILADEPTGNLDEYNTALVMDILREMSKTHLIILVTHEEDIAKNYADRVIEVGDGKAISDRTGDSGEYSAEDSTKIFIGDMECARHEVAGVTFEFFGDIEPCTIRLVGVDGRYYLDTDSAKVKFVDSDSEVAIIAAKKEDYIARERTRRDITLRSLDHIAPLSTRRVFTFGATFREGLGSAFGRGVKAKNKALNICITLLVLSLILVVGLFGRAERDLSAVGRETPDNIVSISMRNMQFKDVSKFYSLLDNSEYVEDYYYHIEASHDGSAEYFRLSLGGYESILESVEYIKTYYRPLSSMPKDTKYLQRTENVSLDSVYLTSGMVKSMFSTYKFDDDLLRMVMQSTVVDKDGEKMLGKIAGIVESDEHIVYATPAYIATYTAPNTADYGIIDFYKESALDNTIYYVPGSFIYESYIESGKLRLATQGITMDAVPIDASIVPSVSRAYVTMSTFEANRTAMTYLKNALTNDVDSDVLSFYAENRMEVFVSDVRAFSKSLLDNDDINGSTSLEDKDDIVRYRRMSIKGTFNLTLIFSIVIYLLLMVLTVILVYANFSSKVKEIGIYRAIGVSKGNILFKVFVEGLASILLTTIIALVVIGMPIFIMSLCGINLLYFSWWLYLILVVALLGGMSIVVMLPVLSIINKTPISILSRYDI